MKKLFIIPFLLICSVSFSQEAPSLSEVLEYKYGKCFGTKQEDEKDFVSKNPKMIISYWKCIDKKPDEKQIELDFTEYQQFLLSEKTKDQQDESNLKSKLKLSDEELDILAKLIMDRI